MRKDYVSHDALAGIKRTFPNVVYDAEIKCPAVYIGADELLALLTFVRDDSKLHLTRMENVTAVDWKDRYEMVYHLFSYERMHWLTVKVTLPHDAPVLPSATAVFPGVAFEEREVYDLMGITFTGHPDLRRVFHMEDFVGHPLRKDFVPPPPPYIPRIRKEGF